MKFFLNCDKNLKEIHEIFRFCRESSSSLNLIAFELYVPLIILVVSLAHSLMAYFY